MSTILEIATKPISPEIQINPSIGDASIPQAWELNGNWYYNQLASLIESKAQNKKIPTRKEWKAFFKKDLQIPLLGIAINVGFRLDQSTHDFHQEVLEFGKSGYYWTSEKLSPSSKYFSCAHINIEEFKNFNSIISAGKGKEGNTLAFIKE